MAAFWQKLGITLEMIKFEHTLFALPFAFLGAVLAAGGLPELRQIIGITLAMFGARSAAMTFNRIADREIDAENPRTAGRELPTGKLSVKFAWSFFFASVGLFLFAAYSLNWLTLALSPVALASIIGYSYAKRYTSLSHLFWAGRWPFRRLRPGSLYAGRSIPEIPLLLSLLVLMWTAGFDVMYACQDFDFDKRSGLRSIPATFGIARALWIARLFHLQAFVALILLYGAQRIRMAGPCRSHCGRTFTVYQHTLVSAKGSEPDERGVLYDERFC